jgi:hypothetical protein
MDKIECKICHGLYVRVCTHARQKHEVTAREYKEAFGYDVRKGIMTDADREHMRELAYINGMPERLQRTGAKTRFKKAQTGLGKYQRSQQTLERLRLHGQSLPHRKKTF